MTLVEFRLMTDALEKVYEALDMKDEIKLDEPEEGEPCEYCHRRAKLRRVHDDMLCSDCAYDVLYCERGGKEEARP